MLEILSRRLAVLVVVLLVAQGRALALDPSLAIHQFAQEIWQAKEGLPENSVQGITQTSDGYLWLATQVGLVRFDGARFTLFDKSNSPGLLSSTLTSLRAASDGTLWMGSSGGLVRFRGGKFHTYTTDDGLGDNMVWAVDEAPDRSIWIATYNRGVARLHNGLWTRYTTANGLPSNSITTIRAASDGTIWIGTAGSGLSSIKNGSVKTYRLQDGLPNENVWAIEEGENGEVWIGSNGGLTRLALGRFSTWTKNDGLRDSMIRSLYRDRHNALWIGSGTGGLHRLYRGEVTSFSKKDGLSDDTILDLFEDRKGSLWIATEGGGVNQLREGKFRSVTVAEGLGHDFVWSILEARDGSRWIGTNGGVTRLHNGRSTVFDTATGLSNDVVRALHEDRSGTIWIGTNGGLNRFRDGRLTTFRTADGLPHDVINCITSDATGAIWIGTRGGGVSRYADGRFTNFNSSSGLSSDVVYAIAVGADGTVWAGGRAGVDALRHGRATNIGGDSLRRAKIRAIRVDRDGVLWIGTVESGLFRVAGSQITSYTSRNGLSDDAVFQILEDGRGNLWLPCEKGVSRVARSDLEAVAAGRMRSVTSVAYGRADGMKSICNAGSSPAGWRMQNGELWLPTDRGVATLDPAVVNQSSDPPMPLIEEVVADGRIVPAAARQSLGASTKNLEIHYTAPFFPNNKRIRFRYRLIGHDSNWIDAGNRRVAYYSYLPAGKLRFQVMPSDESGAWRGRIAEIELARAPRFRETPWFVALVASVFAAAVGCIWILHRLRVRLIDGKAAASLLALSRKNEMILSSTADGVIGVDLDGAVTFINRAATEKLGLSDTVTGQRIHALVHAQADEKECRLLHSIEAARASAEDTFNTTDGSPFPVEYSRQAVVDEKGQLMGAVFAFRDITDRRIVERMRAELIATVSHELRTPLTSMRGSLGLLSAGAIALPPEKQRRMIDIAITNTDRLLRLVNDILDIEKLQSGSAAWEVAPCQAGSVVEDAAEVMFGLAAKSGVDLQVRPFDAVILADRDRIIQTLTNLISNAIKFSRDGTVTVAGDIRGDFALFTVRDTGRGIPPEKLDTIFERFGQVEAADRKEKGGTGLGLPICRTIVEQHGGAISVESEYRKGSCFSFTIPLALDASAQSPIRKPLLAS